MPQAAAVPYTAHPAAKLFPAMQAEELKTLAQDIQANGLIEPILLYEGQILDGRNRLAACGLAGVSPRYADAPLNGSSPTLFVVSKNLHRRHLTQSQRAGISALLMPMLQEEAKERIHRGEKNGGRTAGNGRPKNSSPPFLAETYSDPDPNELRGESRSIAAQAMQVGKTTVQTAYTVKKKDPEEFERIMRGEISVNQAYKKVMREERGKAHQAVRTPGKRQRIRERAARNRMIEALSEVRGMCRGIAQMNIAMIAAAVTEEERRAFVAIGYETARILRDFARKLGAEK